MTQIILEYDNWSVCAICYQKVTDDQYDCCVICGSEFHRKHLQSWLVIDNTCPVCRSTIQPTKRQIFLPFHIQNSIYKDPRNHRLFQVSNGKLTLKNNPLKRLTQYPMDASEPIQIGYSKSGFFEQLKNEGYDLSYKGIFAFIGHLIIFFLYLILPFIWFFTGNPTWILLWLVVMIIFVILFSTINQSEVNVVDRYKL